MTSIRRPFLLALLVVAVAAALLPSVASAADSEPSAISDPPSAFQDDEAPATIPVPATPAATNEDSEAMAENGTVGGVIASGGEVARTAVTVPAVAGTTHPVGSGTLPFTGVDSAQIALLMLVGSLLVAAGMALQRAARRMRA